MLFGGCRNVNCMCEVKSISSETVIIFEAIIFLHLGIYCNFVCIAQLYAYNY